MKQGAKKRKGRGFAGKKTFCIVMLFEHYLTFVSNSTLRIPVVSLGDSASKNDDSYDTLEAGQTGETGPARCKSGVNLK